MNIQFQNRKTLQEVTYNSAPLEPQEVIYLEKRHRIHMYWTIVATFVTIGIIGASCYHVFITPLFDIANSDAYMYIPILVGTAALMTYIARYRGRLVAQDLSERMKLVLHTTLYRKKIDRDDGKVEYELNFEGLTDDLDVKKDMFDRFVEGHMYEVEVSRHAKYIFRIRDIDSKEMLFSLIQ